MSVFRTLATYSKSSCPHKNLLCWLVVFAHLMRATEGFQMAETAKVLLRRSSAVSAVRDDWEHRHPPESRCGGLQPREDEKKVRPNGKFTS
eukprot:scaffold13857_cov33-Prasinocladus_malaysianus.AAC.1